MYVFFYIKSVFRTEIGWRKNMLVIVAKISEITDLLSGVVSCHSFCDETVSRCLFLDKQITSTQYISYNNILTVLSFEHTPTKIKYLLRYFVSNNWWFLAILFAIKQYWGACETPMELGAATLCNFDVHTKCLLEIIWVHCRN